jgi:hypothetical protein
MTRREALADAGFTFDGLDMYDDFYRSASEFAHAEPSRYLMHNLDGELILGRMNRKEILYLLGAYVSSLDFFLIAFEGVNKAFDLKFSERIQHFKDDFFEFAPVYRAAIIPLGDSSYRNAKITLSRRKRTFVIRK